MRRRDRPRSISSRNWRESGSGAFGFDFAVGGAVPESSTWAMMLVGFAGLGFAAYRARKGRDNQFVSILKSARRGEAA